MSLNEPSVGVTTGPDWATQVNENFETIDTHDHTSGKGVQLTPSALNINADLEFNSNAAIELKRLTFDSGATGSGTNYSVYQQGGNLYWYNGSGQAVQITNGASVKTTGGSIDGMSGTDAQVLFGSGIYRFEFDTTLTPFSGSKMAHADILLYKYDGSTGSDAYVILKYTGSSAGSNNITVPDETGTMLTTSTSFGGNISIAATGGSNTITLDAEGDINLDSDSGVINFKDGGTAIGKISNSSSDLVIENEVDAKDIIFKQYDGNEVVRMADDRRLYFFDKGGEYIVGDGTDLTIASSNDLNLTATTDINVPANVGLTFGNDGEKIEGNGTDLTIASSATLNVNTGSASGNDLKVNTSQLVVEGDTGNVGVGGSPSYKLDVKGSNSGGPVTLRVFNETANTSGSKTQILMPVFNGTSGFSITSDSNGTDGYNAFLTTGQGGSSLKLGSGAGTLAMTIDSSQNVQLEGSLTAGTIGSGVVFPTGSILRIHSTSTTTQLNSFSSATYVDAITLTISNPVSSSSKFLIQNTAGGLINNVSYIGVRVVRVVGATTTVIATHWSFHNRNEQWNGAIMFPISVQDAPSTDSAITYKIQIYASSSSQAYWNYAGPGSANNESFLTVTEYQG